MIRFFVTSSLLLLLACWAGCPHDLTRRAWDSSGGPRDSGREGGGDVTTQDSSPFDALPDQPRDQWQAEGAAADTVAPHDGVKLDTKPPPDVGPLCGNNKVDAGEQCDGKNLQNKTCSSEGYFKGTLKCTTGCTLDLSGCSYCGNGKLDSKEECDGAQLKGATCKSKNFSGGQMACSTACSLDTSGCYRVLDPAGKGISFTNVHEVNPVVAPASGGYLVVWQHRASTTKLYTRAARFSLTGTVTDKNGINVNTSNTFKSKPAVATNGTEHLVAWSDDTGLVRGARITGNKVKFSGNKLSQSGGAVADPHLAFDGANFMTAWAYDWSSGFQYWDINGARVSSSVSPVGKADLVFSNYTAKQQLPAVACGKKECLVVWQDTRSAKTRIYGARVTKAGKVQDPLGFLVSRTSTSVVSPYQLSPAVAWSGISYLVVWTDMRGTTWDVYGARVSTSGTVLDSVGIPICATTSGNQTSPSVVSRGKHLLVVWDDTRNGHYDIYAARMTPLGKVLDPAGFSLASSVYQKRYPEVACSGGQCLVVWQELRNKSYDIYGARIK